MHSVWEKLNPPYEIVRQMCEAPLSSVICCAPAQWSHSWRTQDMPESRVNYYCEQHALEHGLSNYVTACDKDPLGRLYEMQAEQTTIPYGGAPGEIEEEEEEEDIEERDGLDEYYIRPFDDPRWWRCPRCNENHPPPSCSSKDMNEWARRYDELNGRPEDPEDY